MSDVLLRDTPADGVLRLTINRPESLNAITIDVQRRIDAALVAAADDPSVRAIVLAGAGGRALSAGYDIHELTSMTEDEHTLVQVEREELLWRWTASPVPTVVACTGTVFGAGMLLATCADLRVGSASTKIKVTATMYGGANLTWILDQLVGASLARDMLLTSRLVGGEEAARAGFLSRYVEDDDVADDATAGGAVPGAAVVDAAVAAAAEIAAIDPRTVAEVKRLLLAGPGAALRPRYDAENTVMLTTLRPGPLDQTFATFLNKKPG
jgi:enoyl-CoA hydratase/carnithine racemase